MKSSAAATSNSWGGRCCGNIFGNKCEILGGLVLIGIGIKVLIWG